MSCLWGVWMLAGDYAPPRRGLHVPRRLRALAVLPSARLRGACAACPQGVDFRELQHVFR
jgi:hypothetical protein